MTGKTCIARLMLMCGLLCWAGAVQADDDANAQRRGDEYYLAAGKTYNRHAAEHAKLLSKYAATGAPVPASVVAEHAAAIKAGLDSAEKSFDKVSPQAKSNADVAAQLANLKANLAKANGKVAELQAAAAANQASDSAKIAALSSQINQLLKMNHEAHQTVYQTINPNQGPWYTDGSFDE